MGDRLYVGIDLGTYQSTIASSAGSIETIETVVGRPKDPVARNFLGRDVLFGNDENIKIQLSSSLHIYPSSKNQQWGRQSRKILQSSQNFANSGKRTALG